MTLSDAILTALRNASSQMPMSFGALQEAVEEIAGLVMPDEFADHLESLCDAAQVRAIRGQRGGIWQNLYWSVTPTAPINATEEDTMSEQKNTLLARMILMHGPIAGAALAEKARETGANIPAKNVPGLLETLVRKSEVIAKKYMAATWYMTPNQADEWDERFRLASGSEQAGHVMSAPVKTKQSVAENPVNESDEAMPEADPVLLASANRMLSQKVENLEADIEKQRQMLAANTETIVLHENTIHDLRNDVCAANLIFDQLAKTLKVEQPEQIPAAIDELTHALATRAMQTAEAPGRLALIVYTDTDADLQFLEPFVTQEDASQIALNQVNGGGSERCAVIRVLGEARRPAATWKPLVAPAIATLRGEHQEAA